MKKYSGFTLLEILLYVVIGGITLVIVAFSFVQITRLSTTFRVNNELNQTGENIIRQIQYNINNNMNDNKGSIISPIVGGGTSSLLKIQNNTSFVQYNITQNSTDIIYSQSNQSDIKLNPTNIQILASSLSFEQINNQDQNSQNGIMQAIKVKFTLVYKKPTLSGNEYDAQKAFETVIPIEQAKQTSFTPILNDNPIIPAGQSPNYNYGVAYSLRKLSGINNSSNKFSDGYIGGAIRVRRDRGADQTENDIGFTQSGDLDTVSLQNFVGYQNFLTQSENITTTGLWNLGNITSIADDTVAPNGTTTAERVSLNSGNVTRSINKDTTLTNGTIYTDSYYVKANNGYNFVQLAPTGAGFTGNTSYQNYNLSTGQLGSSSGMIAGQSTINSVGNGWYRISLSATAAANGLGNITLAIVNSSSSARLETVNVASATNSIYVWGGQRHISSSLTSGPKTYQPTIADANTGYGYVTIWYDQSGNNNNAIQTTTANQPKIIDGITGIVLQNNKPSIQFDGSNDELASINAFSSASPKVFWVGKRSGYTQSFLARNTTYATLTLGSDLFTSYYLNGSTTSATSSSDSLSNLNLYYASGNPVSSSQFVIGRGAIRLNGFCSEIMEYNNSPVTDSVQINIKNYYGL